MDIQETVALQQTAAYTDFNFFFYFCLRCAFAFNNNNNNNRVYIAPYDRNFRGAGGRSDQCSVKARE